MSTTLKIGLSLALLLAVFLGGFVPQYLKAKEFEGDLATARQQTAHCEQALRLSEFRDLATSLYFQTLRQNYGLAGESANRFFSELRTLASSTADPGLKGRLEEVLGLRDPVTAALAKATPEALTQTETLVTKTQQLVKP